MNYPKEVLEALQRDQGITFRGKHNTDARFCYGATCTWFGSIHETKSTPGPHGGIPCCPLCGGVLYELPDEGEWWGGIDAYEKEGHPDYRAMWEWQRGQKKCFSSRNGIDVLVAAYQSAVGKTAP